MTAVPVKNLEQLRSANIRRQAEWPGGEHVDFAFRGLELAGEAGELCNLIKKQVRINSGISGTLEGEEELHEAILDEIGDVLICLDLMGMDLAEPTALKGSGFKSTEARVLAALGCSLDSRVGYLSGICAGYTVNQVQETPALAEHFRQASSEVGTALQDVANVLGADLWTCTMNKFNKTSIKHNLSTRVGYQA